MKKSAGKQKGSAQSVDEFEVMIDHETRTYRVMAKNKEDAAVKAEELDRAGGWVKICEITPEMVCKKCDEPIWGANNQCGCTRVGT